uniref:Uncharacterized protein n=1 Tax=uncultured marine bacterium 463 TaxID=257394 RepID=Q6SGL7_9BACT|nr:hypothetical protein MBMO_EBAC080-L32B05.93 [uncultured marine bacterium 463]
MFLSGLLFTYKTHTNNGKNWHLLINFKKGLRHQ